MVLTYMNETLAKSLSGFTQSNDLTPDNFIVFEDLSIDDKSKMTRLQELTEKSYTTEAEKAEMTQLLIDLRPYMPTSEDWNKFCASIYSMQVYMRDEVVVFINQKQQELINNYRFIGTWDNITNYSIGNMVLFDGMGFTSRINNNKGNQPDKNVIMNDNWVMYTLKGDKGDPSLNIFYRGEYDPTKTYNLSTGDACTLNGTLYYVNAEGVHGVSPTDTNKWITFQKPKVNIVVTNNQSITRENDTFYFILK